MQFTEPETPKFGAVVLAGGTSSRMVGVDKLLLEIDGESMIARSYRIFKELNLDPVVVTGFDHGRLDAFLHKENPRVFHNSRFMEGQHTSVLAGLAALPTGYDAVIIALADMPLLASHDVHELMRAYALRPKSCAAVVPGSGTTRGNPVIIDAALVPLILAKGKGVRPYLNQKPELIHWHITHSPGYYVDIDTPEDVEMLNSVYGLKLRQKANNGQP